MHASTRPVALLHVPAAHGTGVVDPGGQYVPGEHRTRLATGVAQKKPPKHVSLAVRPAIRQVVPGKHSSQSATLEAPGSARKVLVEHGAGSVDPSAQ